jgi:SAM-dependent methyltransferase
MWADQALQKLLTDHDHEFVSVLDVGSGPGEHARAFRDAGKVVTETDWSRDGDYLLQHFDEPFDLVWCSHVLEHMPNVRAFLMTLSQDCKPGGLLAITVPPAKPEIVGGHLSLWNAGLLVYNLVVAGVDCKAIRLKRYGYNISAIVRNNRITLPRLVHDSGDLDTLKPYLPDWLTDGANGEIDAWNW